MSGPSRRVGRYQASSTVCLGTYLSGLSARGPSLSASLSPSQSPWRPGRGVSSHASDILLRPSVRYLSRLDGRRPPTSASVRASVGPSTGFLPAACSHSSDRRQLNQSFSSNFELYGSGSFTLSGPYVVNMMHFILMDTSAAQNAELLPSLPTVSCLPISTVFPLVGH